MVCVVHVVFDENFHELVKKITKLYLWILGIWRIQRQSLVRDTLSLSSTRIYLRNSTGYGLHNPFQSCRSVLRSFEEWLQQKASTELGNSPRRSISNSQWYSDQFPSSVRHEISSRCLLLYDNPTTFKYRERLFPIGEERYG